MLGLGDAAGPGIASTADAGHRALLPFPDVRSLSRLPPFAWKASRRPSLRLWSSPGTGHRIGEFSHPWRGRAQRCCWRRRGATRPSGDRVPRLCRERGAAMPVALAAPQCRQRQHRRPHPGEGSVLIGVIGGCGPARSQLCRSCFWRQKQVRRRGAACVTRPVHGTAWLAAAALLSDDRWVHGSATGRPGVSGPGTPASGPRRERPARAGETSGCPSCQRRDRRPRGCDIPNPRG
jgi:hypothetical protein